jgi:rhodanese-related sulfurtransferase
VNDNSAQPAAPVRRASAGKVFLEAALVAAAGLILALAANQISPLGLALGRNYFPQKTDEPPPVAGTNFMALSPAQRLAAELNAKGLQSVDAGRAAQLFRDPRYKQGAVVFIDARDEPHYLEGHIPGAHEFDPYRPEKYFADVLPLCQSAGQIIVYCNGGDCDDSEAAAILLRDVGIPNSKIFVFGGGFGLWQTNGLPVETGAFNSGNVRNAGK